MIPCCPCPVPTPLLGRGLRNSGDVSTATTINGRRHRRHCRYQGWRGGGVINPPFSSSLMTVSCFVVVVDFAGDA